MLDKENQWFGVLNKFKGNTLLLKTHRQVFESNQRLEKIPLMMLHPKTKYQFIAYCSSGLRPKYLEKNGSINDLVRVMNVLQTERKTKGLKVQHKAL